MQTGISSGPAIGSATAVLAAGLILLAFYDLSPQARHMGLHIAAMNVGAPVFAALTGAQLRVSIAARPRWLWLATLGQIVLLWLAHAPAVQAPAMAYWWAQIAIHLLLFAAAFVFWLALLSQSAGQQWHSVAALLLSGKLVCLLAALLVFAPRALYASGHGHTHALDDQQLAGLLMIAACPLSYLVAAIAIATRLIGGGSLRPARSPG
jgi:putative membrane protein